jgi:hypothetical protein
MYHTYDDPNMNFIDKESILARIPNLDEFEKRQLYDYLSSKDKKAKDDLFVISNDNLEEVKNLLDFMYANRKDHFETLEREKERLRPLFQERVSKKNPYEITIERFLSIPIISPLHQVVMEMKKDGYVANAEKAGRKNIGLKKPKTSFKKKPVLDRIYTQIKQTERENAKVLKKKGGNTSVCHKGEENGGGGDDGGDGGGDGKSGDVEAKVEEIEETEETEEVEEEEEIEVEEDIVVGGGEDEDGDGEYIGGGDAEDEEDSEIGHHRDKPRNGKKQIYKGLTFILHDDDNNKRNTSFIYARYIKGHTTTTDAKYPVFKKYIEDYA